MNIETDLGLRNDLERARRISQAHFGPSLEFFLPGMFVLNGQTGLYPAVSLTGDQCRLACEHCRGQLLANMYPARTPEALLGVAKDLQARGRRGLLISGGSDIDGRLPWEPFLGTIETIVHEVGLTVTVHAGYLDTSTARRLKATGVKQALVDVIGDDQTARTVYHLAAGTKPIWETLEALASVDLEVVPHLILGLDYGLMLGEYQALEGLVPYKPARLVMVVLRPLSGTPMAGLKPPPPLEVARFMIQARQMLPEARHHLGCARPKGRYGRLIETIAVQAGVNALALPSEEAWTAARKLGLEPVLIPTCCSLAGTTSSVGREM